MAPRKARILILCKTYPSPSARYAETSCVAGFDPEAGLVRLFPVPFRLIGDAGQFKKWQWIDAQISKARDDHRPESHRIGVDTIRCGPVIPTRRDWIERRRVLAAVPDYSSFTDLDAARTTDGATLGLLRPYRVLGLEITACTPDWTDEQKRNLIQMQEQANLFEQTDAPTITALRKVPFDFHYRYACLDSDGVEVEHRHKIADWEAGALYWRLRRSHGDRWEGPFRHKLEHELPARDLMFLMGTIHRFPDQWLITSLIYPPMQPPGQQHQGSLF